MLEAVYAFLDSFSSATSDEQREGLFGPVVEVSDDAFGRPHRGTQRPPAVEDPMMGSTVAPAVVSARAGVPFGWWPMWCAPRDSNPEPVD
jgi:hypothetical protein